MVEDFVANYLDHFEGGLARYRVYEHIAVNPNRVLGIQNGVFVLASGVNNFRGVFLVFVLDGLAEGVFDRGIVALHKVRLHKLHGQR